MKKIGLFILVLSVASSVFAQSMTRRCNDEYVLATDAQEQFVHNMDQQSESRLVTLSKRAVKSCSVSLSEMGDTLGVNLLKAGSLYCENKNRQNSPAAEAVCMIKILDVIQSSR